MSLAPCVARWMAMASPRPWLEPTIQTTLPSNARAGVGGADSRPRDASALRSLAAARELNLSISQSTKWVMEPGSCRARADMHGSGAGTPLRSLPAPGKAEQRVQQVGKARSRRRQPRRRRGHRQSLLKKLHRHPKLAANRSCTVGTGRGPLPCAAGGFETRSSLAQREQTNYSPRIVNCNGWYGHNLSKRWRPGGAHGVESGDAPPRTEMETGPAP